MDRVLFILLVRDSGLCSVLFPVQTAPFHCAASARMRVNWLRALLAAALS
jgi:hypothetical protein